MSVEVIDKSPAVPLRQPPHNLDAEKAALGAVLIKARAIDSLVAVLDIDDFFLPAHREIFDAMVAMCRRGDEVDVIGVIDELQKRGMIKRLDGGEGYFLALTAALPTAENVEFYVKVVKEKATLRRMIGVCAEMSARAHADYGDFESFIGEWRTLTASVDSKIGNAPVRMGDKLEHAMRVVEARADDPKRFFVRTGLRKFDRIVGGYQRDDLVIVAAPPGGGKSAWAVNNVALASAREGVPNLIFSMEMSLQQLQERAIGSLAQFETRNIHRGKLVADDWKRLRPAEKILAPLPIWVFEPGATIDDIASQARRWTAQRRSELPPGPDGLPALVNITVDYIQIVKRAARRGPSSEADAIGEVTRGLKALAKELGCPVSGLSQFNREFTKEIGRKAAGKHKPRPADLKGSSSIEQDADKIIFLWPEEPPSPHPGEPPITRTAAEIIVGKNRGGAVGSIPCLWERRTMTFLDEDLDPDLYGMDDPRLPPER